MQVSLVSAKQISAEGRRADVIAKKARMFECIDRYFWAIDTDKRFYWFMMSFHTKDKLTNSENKKNVSGKSEVPL